MRILSGWKAIGDYLGFHWRTLQRWHLTIMRLPITKTGNQRNSRIVTTDITALNWAMKIGKVKGKTDKNNLWNGKKPKK